MRSQPLIFNFPSLATQIFSQSIQVHPKYLPLSNKLSKLKQQSKSILNTFEQFKQTTLNHMNKSMGRLTSLIQRQISTNAQLRDQLDVVKNSNHNMKKQVVQLREMIQEFVTNYNTEIEAKDKQIRDLKMQLGFQMEQKNNQVTLPSDYPQQKRNSLQIIQQVSQYTGSCLPSIRQMSIPNSAKGSIIPIVSNQSNMSNLSQTHEDSWAEEDRTNKSKSYLNFFRKNVDECVVIFQQKKEQKQNDSHLSSVEDLHLGDTDKINLPKSIKSPKNMQFVKSSAKKFSIQQGKENIQCLQLKKTPHRRSNSQGEQKTQCASQKQSRSNSKAKSKQKIKITSKIIDQFNSFNCKNNKKTPITVRPSVHLGAVHLGGKAYLKKLIKQVKPALQEFKIWEGSRAKEVRYDGQRKNGMRWGKGKLLFDNGFQYDGSFVQNYRHGMGTISLNGIIFYQGQWSLDQISGQGYVKSLKNYSQNCPGYLRQASYCGQLLENKFHGMGTLFLNQSQKIVTKFIHGAPVGEFTYYSRSQIQFGNWY